MSYSNYSWSIYLAIKSIINTEIPQCEIESRNRFPTIEEDEKAFVGKYLKGIIVRIESDSLGEAGSNSYEDRHYIYRLRGYVNDPAKDQKNLMDFMEHIKYALQNNKQIIADSSYSVLINLEYIEPEIDSIIKTADLTLEVLKDG